jgi:hypothetical protein
LTLIALLISALAVIISVLLYFKQPVQLFLRVAAIVLIYVLATNFSFSINTTAPQNDPVILIDHSQSMKNHLPYILDKISGLKFPHESLFFQESLTVKEEPGALGEYTDITTAISKVHESNPAILILITDGNHNFGASPLSVLDDINMPVQVYGIGEERPRDVSIVDVAYPVYAYQEDTMEIRAVVESGGFQTGSGEATLQLDSGKKIAVQRFPLSNTPARYTLDFVYVAQDPGKIRFNIDLTPQSDEISYNNNTSPFAVNILQNKIRVLYYTDHISFNTKYIMRSLRKDRNLSISAIHSPTPGMYQNIEQNKISTSPPDRDQYDVVILDNVNLGRLNWLRLPEMANENPGIILSGVLEGINAAWKRIIPIDITAGMLRGNYQLRIVEPFSVLNDNEYPPLQHINRIVGSKQDAVIIARTNELPLIAYREHGRSRIFQVSIIDLGTWHFLQRGLRDHDFLYYFFGDIIRFLSPLGKHERLVLSTQRREHTIGETVDLTLQSYNRDFRRIGGGDFFLVADEEKIPFYETKEGFYEASFLAQKTGELSIFAQGQIEEKQLVSNELLINVSSRYMETEHRLNRALLERIAAATGGEFFPLEKLDQLTLPTTHKKQVSKVINFNSPIIYVAILVFSVVDWIIRRWRGMT